MTSEQPRTRLSEAYPTVPAFSNLDLYWDSGATFVQIIGSQNTQWDRPCHTAGRITTLFKKTLAQKSCRYVPKNVLMLIHPFIEEIMSPYY